MNSICLIGRACIPIALALLLPPLGRSQADAQQPLNPRDLTYTPPKPPASGLKPTSNVTIPRGYALIIGIANYKNLAADAQLKFSERDAESIYSVLISKEGGNFPAENVHKVIGSAATLKRIREELEEWLPLTTHDDDRVVVYFAGHGFEYEGKAYLAPFDIDGKRIAETAYPMDALGAVFGGKIKGKWKVLLTDACRSGAITPQADAQAINGSLMNLNKSLFSLTAASDRGLSYESEAWGGGSGVFTYYVVKGLEGWADTNEDGIVTADELAEYVHREVRDATRNAVGGRQSPTSERGSYDPDMPLAYSPRINPGGNATIAKTGTLVITVNTDQVEIFVDGRSEGTAGARSPKRLPGLPAGKHIVQGVKMGYEPDGPREEFVYPGEEVSVALRIVVPRRRSRVATDEFEKGIALYVNKRGQEAEYKRAAAHFAKAVALDSQYSQAALYLGRTYNALYDQEKSLKFFKRAIEIDPDYLEAHTSYAGALLDTGDLDEAVRQLSYVIQRAPKQGFPRRLLAEAFTRKEAYSQAIEQGRVAIQLSPNIAESHFWLAEALRRSGNNDEGKAEYAGYLKLSNFNSGLIGQINYYLIGFSLAKRKRASQNDIWKELQAQAYFGICDCERQQRHWDEALRSCDKALSYDDKDAYAHYAMGLILGRKGKEMNRPEYLDAALVHFNTMLKINPDLDEAKKARVNIDNINQALGRN